MNKKLDLLGDDYYSKESSLKYWSVSQYKRFKDCQARALAELKGEWSEDNDNTALLVGNYVHSYFESPEAHADFITGNGSQLISRAGATKGKLKKDYVVADRMIEALKDDDEFTKIYVGQKEVSVTSEINGIPFKGKIDCLNLGNGYFVDIKTSRYDIDESIWSSEYEARVRWFEAFGYVLQMAVYKELIYQTYGVECHPIIYVVTKHDIPDTRAIFFKTQERLDFEFQAMKNKLPDFNEVKTGLKEPLACGRCEYCRANKLTPRLEVW